MTRPWIADTGPLVALLNRREMHHDWASEQIGVAPLPLLTCETVLCEASYLLRFLPAARLAMLDRLRRGALRIAIRLDEQLEPVSRLMARYADVPMSLADACLVRMTEIYADCAVLTLDAGFRVYRRHGRQVVPTIMPAPRAR